MKRMMKKIVSVSLCTILSLSFFDMHVFAQQSADTEWNVQTETAAWNVDDVMRWTIPATTVYDSISLVYVRSNQEEVRIEGKLENNEYVFEQQASTSDLGNCQIVKIEFTSEGQNYISEIEPVVFEVTAPVQESDELSEPESKTITNVLQDGMYIIRLKENPGFVVDVKWASLSDHANVQLYEFNNTNAQKWIVNHDEQGYVTFTSLNSDKVLEVDLNDGNIEQNTYTGSMNQKWIVSQEGTIISAENNNRMITIESGTVQNLSNVQLEEKQGDVFVFEQVQAEKNEMDELAENNKNVLTDGEYNIFTKVNSKFSMDVSQSNVQLYHNTKELSQIWIVSHDSKGYVTFTNKKSGNVLTLQNDSVKDSQNIIEAADTNAQGQKWIVLSDGRIVSALDKNYVVDLRYASDQDGANIHLYTYNGTNAQKWVFKEPKADNGEKTLDELAFENKDVLADGNYIIQAGTEQVVEVANASSQDSANVQIHKLNNAENQVWKVSHDGFGYVTFINANSGKALDIHFANVKNGENIQQYQSNGSKAQKWIVTKEGKVISALDSEYVMDVEGTNVQLHKAEAGRTQAFTFKKYISEKEKLDNLALENKDVLADGHYLIQSAEQVIEVAKSSLKDSANVQVDKKDNGTNQVWEVVHDEQGYVTFINANSEKALDIHFANVKNGENIQQYESNGSKAQKWIVTKEGKVISALNSHYVLDLEGTNVQLYESEEGRAQTFTFQEFDLVRGELDNLASDNKGVLQDGVYTIHSQLNFDYGLSTKESNVVLNEIFETKDQAWQVSHDEQGYVSFVNLESQQYLSVEKDKAENFANVGQNNDGFGFNKKWIVMSDGRIISALDSDFVLDLRYASVENGSNIQLYASNNSQAQKWTFDVYNENQSQIHEFARKNKNVLQDGYYIIQSSLNNNFVADVRWASKDDMANVQLYQSNNTSAQKWKVTHDKYGYVTFTCQKSNKVLEIAEDGSNICQGINEQKYTQKWIVTSEGKIVSGSDLNVAVDLEVPSAANETNILCKPNSDSTSQIWQFAETNSFDSSELESNIRSIINRYGGDVGVYFKDLNSDESFSINSHYMYPCCIIKTAVIATVYHKADLGQLDLSTYLNDLYYLIAYSDNTAYNTILRRLGNGNGVAGAYLINDYMRSLGIYEIELHHGLRPGSGYFTDGGSNRATPVGIGQLLEKIYDGEICGESLNNQMIQTLCGCLDSSALRQGLPGNVAFAHKTGCAYELYHDGGIVYCDSQPYILVVFTDRVYSRTSFFREISSYIYNYEKALTY